MGSSYHVTVQGENGVPSSMEDNAELEDVSPYYHISFNDGVPQEDEDTKDAPPELEEGVKATIDTLKEVNLGTDEKPRHTYLSSLLEVDEESTYIELLKEFRDIFAWSYKEMNGLDPKVAVHHLAVKNGAHPVNIVPVKKKNGQIRVCVDFRDLNNACPKDEFPLPIPELIIDATTSYEAMSFIDGWSGYNQIRMAPKDEELTAFRTPKGIYCYTVMPFGLKNVGATYQRAMRNIFDDLLHKNVECYVDDLVVKSREKGDHLKDLRMAVKGQALADFLADHLIPYDWELTDELPDEDAMVVEDQPPWKMYFDGAAHREGAGTGIVFVTSQGEVLPYSFTLTQLCSNNIAEYQALILGLKMAVDTKQLQLQVFGDSQLVVNQLLGSYEVKKPELRPYHDYAKNLMGWLGDVTIQHVVPPPNEAKGEENELKHLVAVSKVEKEEWRQPIIDYLCYGILPENSRRKTEIYRRAPRFLYYKDTLYRRSFEGVLLRCLGEEEALQALQEAHSGVCGSHQSRPKLHFHIKRMGYYWPTMVKDCLDYARRCNAYVALKEVKKENVASFIRVNIIYRFGRYIITDNGKSFDNRLMNKICDLFGFKQRNSSMYNAAANSLAEAFNRTLCNLLKKVISKSKRDWNDRMEEALWAYRTIHRTLTQATPYSLIYGVEVVFPLERQIPSLRLAIQKGSLMKKMLDFD
ncbi:uncharacterized protein [Nicotiana tomentosiformis]|uniref:uncharacterized protein n=1 Tax=Nicotiana tomentosiformis TaxID=4098 RepID=UPI00388C4594